MYVAAGLTPERGDKRPPGRRCAMAAPRGS